MVYLATSCDLILDGFLPISFDEQYFSPMGILIQIYAKILSATFLPHEMYLPI